MDENIIPTEDQIESGESRGAEQESLDDATFEPGAHVEQTGDYEQSEAVQTAFEIVINQQESTPESVPAENISDGKSEGTFKDPLTGKGGDDHGSSSGSKSSDEPVMDHTAEGEQPANAISDSKAAGKEPVGIPPSDIDGNEPVYEMDPDASGSGKEFNEGTNKPAGNTGGIDPQRLGKENLPEGRLYPQAGPGMKGPKSGGKKPGTPPKSGGGPPVGGFGSGSKGNTADDILSDAEKRYKEKKDPNREWLREYRGDDIKELNEASYYLLSPIHTSGSQKSYPIDGDTPMPYTGSFGGGEDPDPKEPVGGVGGDSGKFHPIFGVGGGSDSSGGTPGDKDGDDDSGKFLQDGTMGGGGGGMVDPGDLDYYTPTNLEAAKKGWKSGKR